MSITDIDNMSIGQFMDHIKQIQFLYPKTVRKKITAERVGELTGGDK